MVEVAFEVDIVDPSLHMTFDWEGVVGLGNGMDRWVVDAEDGIALACDLGLPAQ